jgi:hypothetical protein
MEVNLIEAKSHHCLIFYRYCIAAVYIAKDKIAVLTTARELGIVEPGGTLRNLQNLP